MNTLSGDSGTGAESISGSDVKTIVVIGGGFSGSNAIMHILRAARHGRRESDRSILGKLKIVWLDKEGSFGRGLAYCQQPMVGVEAFILNIPVHSMSVFSDDPDLFTRWLSVKAPQYDEMSFAPRSLFGQFIEETLDELEQQACQGG